MKKILKYSDFGEGMKESALVFPTDFFIRSTRKICFMLREMVEFRGYEEIELDFTKVRSCFPDAILPLLTLVSKYRDEGIRFNLSEPVHEGLCKTFESANWLHIMCPEKYDSFIEARPGRIPAQQFRSGSEQHILVNKVIQRILETTTFLDRSHVRALEWSINEITDNVLVHSESDIGGIVQLTLKPKQQEIEFVVSDAGVGIPKSLGATLNTENHSIILEQSIREGITRGVGQGNGLFGTAQVCLHSGGAFSINSGNAYLSLSRGGRVSIGVDTESWPGTSVDCCISYGRPLVLENALRFRNIPHVTVDIIENSYEDDAGAIKFSLADNTESIGSRFSGKSARQFLENLIRMTSPPHVTIDCNGIGLMSSSFADEFFGGLITSLGVQRFFYLFKISEIDQTNLHIVNRSLMQRHGVSLSS